MSEGEQMGRLRREITAAYESTRYKPSDSDMLIASAIDRLAADLAAVKAKVDAVSPEDVAHFVESEKAWVALVTEQRDAAIRERDAANQRRADTVRRLVQAQAEVAQLRDSRDVANRLFGAEQAKVERLRKELEQRQPAGNSPEIPDSSPAAPQPVGQGISPGLPETQPTGNAAPAAGWLTDRERRAVAYFAQVCRDDLVPDEWTDNAGVLLSILARAGSPPVVEVPAMGTPDSTTTREKQLALAYRAAMDAAGVKWKEVGHE